MTIVWFHIVCGFLCVNQHISIILIYFLFRIIDIHYSNRYSIDLFWYVLSSTNSWYQIDKTASRSTCSGMFNGQKITIELENLSCEGAPTSFPSLWSPWTKLSQFCLLPEDQKILARFYNCGLWGIKKTNTFLSKHTAEYFSSFFGLGTAKLHWKLSSWLWDSWYSQISISARDP